MASINIHAPNPFSNNPVSRDGEFYVSFRMVDRIEFSGSPYIEFHINSNDDDVTFFIHDPNQLWTLESNIHRAIAQLENSLRHL